jgi:hypothetical protein
MRLSMAFLAVWSSAADLYRWRWYSISVLYTSLLTVSLSYTKNNFYNDRNADTGLKQSVFRIRKFLGLPDPDTWLFVSITIRIKGYGTDPKH